MMKSIWKKIAVGVGVVLLFLVLSYGFMPQLLDGKVVNQSDITGYVGMSHEMSEWNDAHPDDPTYWTDSMFGGMPTTAISTQNGGDYTQWIYDLLLTGKRPATYLFIALLGAFLLFLAMGVSVPIAVAGAIAVAFCSYNFQIIQVGHNTKMQAIAFMPWVLAALIFTYRSTREKPYLAKAIIGAVFFGITLSFQIKANHQQITYYLAIMVFLYALAELIHVIKNKAWKPFLIASALLLVLGGAGIATNVNKLLPLAKYTPNTMRGGSELTKEGANSKGLELDYATSWSYGWEELPNMLIPDFNGGSSSGAVDPDKSATIKLLRQAGQKNLRETAKNLPLYWGPQPFTAGPMYMGAITIFLFILGLGLYRGREKWWLLAATILAILMAVGSHFMAFTKLCFDYLPLYNKFRTVSMALVVLQVSLPLLGFVTLDRLMRDEYEPKRVRKAFCWAFGLTAGFCFLAWLAPGLFGSFSGASDAGMQDVLVQALVTDRIALFKADAIRSLLLILAASALLLWAFLPKKPVKPIAGFSRKQVAVVAIGLIVLMDLFAAGKRYLNADHFTTPKDFGKPFAERTVDQMIKADEDPQYRVLDLTVNVFNSSVPSYHHKNVGGYSPAKLQRYQDLIDHYLNGEINGLYKQLNSAENLEEVGEWMANSTPVLNALNTRYVILDGDYPPLVNQGAFGSAWFVDSVVPAASPDEEIALLGHVDLRHQAVVTDPSLALRMTEGASALRMTEGASALRMTKGASALRMTDGASALRMTEGASSCHSEEHSDEESITLTSYAPNKLVYSYSAATERLAVFSEIYYPNGWKATVDGQPVEIIRANWTFRAAMLPAGEHQLVMTFMPESYRVGALISAISSLALLVLLVLVFVKTLVINKLRKE